jgi:hypothetical protein
LTGNNSFRHPDNSPENKYFGYHFRLPELFSLGIAVSASENNTDIISLHISSGTFQSNNFHSHLSLAKYFIETISFSSVFSTTEIVYEIDKNYINNISWLGPMAEGKGSEVSGLYIYDDELNVHLIVIDYPFHEE